MNLLTQSCNDASFGYHLCAIKGGCIDYISIYTSLYFCEYVFGVLLAVELQSGRVYVFKYCFVLPNYPSS